MQKHLSHGRLVIASIAALVGLGIWIGTEFQQAEKEKLEMSFRENLSAQTEIYTHSIDQTLEQIQSQARTIQALANKGILLQAQPLHDIQKGLAYWSEIAVQKTGNSEINITLNRSLSTSSLVSPTGKVQKGLLKEFETNYLAFLKEKLVPIIENQDAETQAPFYSLLFPNVLKNNSDWLFIALPPTQGQTLWVTALIDPSEVFQIFKKSTQASNTPYYRAYLVSSRGEILAHTHESYLGSNLKDSALYQNTLQSLFEGRIKTIRFGDYHSVDKLPVLAGALKINLLPVSLVVESIRPRYEQKLDSLIQGSLLSSFGKIIFVLGMIALGITLLKSVRRKKESIVTPAELKEKVKQAKDSEEKEQLRIKVQQPDISAAIEKLAETKELRAKEEQFQNEIIPPPTSEMTKSLSFDEATELSHQFELLAQEMEDLSFVRALLAENVSQLTQSPVLFLKYDSKKSEVILETKTGFHEPDAASDIQVAITEETKKQIEKSIEAGQIPYFSTYKPLSSEILQKLSIAVFEAWGLTTPVSSDSSPFIGILVILQPGVQSTLHRQTLMRMIKTTAVLHDIQKEPKTETSKPVDSSETDRQT